MHELLHVETLKREIHDSFLGSVVYDFNLSMFIYLPIYLLVPNLVNRSFLNVKRNIGSLWIRVPARFDLVFPAGWIS